MNGEKLTLEVFKRILRKVAGEDEDIDLDGDIIDVEFSDLGYDSIALLETAGCLEREFGVRLDDDRVTSSRTPRTLLVVVNDSLTQVNQP